MDQVQRVTDQFDEMVSAILDPEAQQDLSENPFYAAGMAGLDRLRWDFKSGNVADL